MRRNQITLANTFQDYRKSYSEIAKYTLLTSSSCGLAVVRETKIAIRNGLLNYLLNDTVFILNFIMEFI